MDHVPEPSHWLNAFTSPLSPKYTNFLHLSATKTPTQHQQSLLASRKRGRHPLPEADLSKSRPTKRVRLSCHTTMNDNNVHENDLASTSSVVSSSINLGRRTILRPTPPSSKRGTRSPSPSRRMIPLLALATPAVRILQPGSDAVVPDSVSNLKDLLRGTQLSGYIPRHFKVCFLLQIFTCRFLISASKF